MKKKWTDEGMAMEGFPDLEAALLRLGKDYCRKALCERCPVKEDCRIGMAIKSMLDKKCKAG